MRSEASPLEKIMSSTPRTGDDRWVIASHIKDLEHDATPENVPFDDEDEAAPFEDELPEMSGHSIRPDLDPAEDYYPPMEELTDDELKFLRHHDAANDAEEFLKSHPDGE